MKKGLKSWGCSAWKKESSGETSLQPTVSKGACKKAEEWLCRCSSLGWMSAVWGVLVCGRGLELHDLQAPFLLNIFYRSMICKTKTKLQKHGGTKVQTFGKGSFIILWSIITENADYHIFPTVMVVQDLMEEIFGLHVLSFWTFFYLLQHIFYFTFAIKCCFKM